MGTQHPFLIYWDAVPCLMGLLNPSGSHQAASAGKGCPCSSSHPVNAPLLPAPFPGRDSPSSEQLGWDSGKCPAAGEGPGWGWRWGTPGDGGDGEQLRSVGHKQVPVWLLPVQLLAVGRNSRFSCVCLGKSGGFGVTHHLKPTFWGAAGPCNSWLLGAAVGKG